jgi:hypothetical protein
VNVRVRVESVEEREEERVFRIGVETVYGSYYSVEFMVRIELVDSL